MKGEHTEAIAAAEELVEKSAEVEARAALAFVYARAGRTHDARILTERMEAEARSRAGRGVPAHLYAALGRSADAMDLVEAEIRERRLRPNFGALSDISCYATNRACETRCGR